MAIQSRKGVYANFDPSKMLPGEWAVVVSGDPKSNDGTSVYMCFNVGNVKRMATYDDMVENIDFATADVQALFTKDIQAKIKEASETINQANTTISETVQAKNDANLAAQAALDAADRANGIVIGDIAGKTVSFTEATERVNIESGESTEILFGKIKKFFSDLKNIAFTGNFNDLVDDSLKMYYHAGDTTSARLLKTSELGFVIPLYGLEVGTDVKIGRNAQIMGDLTAANIGKTYSASKKIDITTADVGTYFEGANIKLPAGTYIIQAIGQFSSITTDARKTIQIYNKTAGSSLGVKSTWGKYYYSDDCIRFVELSQESTIATRLSSAQAIDQCTTVINALRVK